MTIAAGVVERFVRPGLTDAEPYDAKHHDYAWSHPEFARLMSNEYPFLPSPAVLAAAHQALERVNLYPYSGEDLRRALAEFAGVPVESVILGNGSTEILDVAARTFIGPGDEAVIHVPTYAFFETQTRLCGGEPVLVPMGSGWEFDVDAVVGAVTPRSKAIFLCSPNNPTGRSWTVAELERILATGVPTIVDQAYLECGYSTSFAPLVATHSNLVVTRTMSKAFGLAALRVGYGIADAALIDVFLRVRIPFSLSLIALWAGLAALRDPADLEARRRYISEERERVLDGLRAIPEVTAYPSDGNFVLIDVARSGRTNGGIVGTIRREGILLRAMTSHRLRDTHVRVTIGTREQNDRFLAAFPRALREPASGGAG